MESVKYIGLDVHQSTISVAVLNAEGKLLMQSVIATKATAVLDLLKGLRGELHITFEEGTYSAWLYDVVVGHVAQVVVCNPRKNALLKSGNKSDQIDARKLAELLRAGLLSPVYHGEQSTRTLQQLVASYTALTEDTGRAMRRIKALYRSQAIACAGKKPFGKRHRGEWLARLTDSGQRRRAEWLYQELDAVQVLRREARQAVMVECHKNPAAKFLRTMPFFGPLRAAVLIARVQTPHRFRTKRQFWTYCGLGVGDTQQRRLCGEGWANHAAAQAGVHPRVELELQPRVEKCVQERRDDRQCDGRSVPRVLRNASRQRHAAGHGAPDAGTQDGGDCTDSVEERRDVRSRTSELTSSISAHHHQVRRL
jgi:transposase